jgi:hypothetical protein
MASIQAPYTTFTDLGGDPLDQGYIYIGLVNQNPETSPKAVFWDLARTIPASQPLRTLGGYIVRNGSPARVYTAGDYSITVRNRGAALVSTSPNGTTISADQISADDGAGGELWSTVQGFIDAGISVATYAHLRANTRTFRFIDVTGYFASASPSKIAGRFVYDPSDTSSADNGGTILVRADGKRYKRSWFGPLMASWFQPVGDGVALDTGPLQAFFNEALRVGGQAFIDKGTYLTAPLTLFKTSAQRHDGAKISGAGINGTVLNFTGSGKAINIRGIPAANGTGTQSGTYFIWDLELSNMTLDGAAKTGNLDAVELVGLWNSKFENLTIRQFRYGIISNGDLAYNPNPDWSSTTNCEVRKVNFERLTEHGFYNTVVQAAPGWKFTESLFVLCGQGGIQLASGGITVDTCGFAGCGWSSETATPKVNGSGILIGGNVTVASQIVIKNCEFDTNYTSHIDFVFAGGVTLMSNRYIFNDRFPTGNICPTSGAVRIAAYGATNAVQNLTFMSEFFRLDDVSATGSPICFNFANNANVQNIRVIGAGFSDNNSTLNLIRAQGHTSGNAWITNNYQLDLASLDAIGSHVVGRPEAEYVATISGTPSTAGGNVEAVLPFSNQESVNASIFGATLYNTSTNVFTCPAPGYYTIYVNVAITATVSPEYNAIRLYVNGSYNSETGGVGGGVSRTHYSRQWRLFCAAGTTLQLREVCSVSRAISGANSLLQISLER